MLKTTALITAAALGLAACGSSSSTSSSASAGGGGYGGGTKSTTTAAASSGKTTDEVEIYDDYFQPKTITGKAGSTVKIKLKNEGNNEHNFTIDSQKKTGADADLEPGKDSSVTVKIPASGTLQFYCEYHKGLGMVGTVKPS